MFHLHGYKFQVVKMTYPVVDSANPVLRVGKVADLSCESELCLEVGWSDVNWKGGNIPGVISEAAPLKDTLLIPVGGYAVIQFKADNPGKLIYTYRIIPHRAELFLFRPWRLNMFFFQFEIITNVFGSY